MLAVKQIIECVDGDLSSQPRDCSTSEREASLDSLQIAKLKSLESASNHDIACLFESRYLEAAQRSLALVIVTSEDLASALLESDSYIVTVQDPYRAFAELSSLFSSTDANPLGVHDSATIDKTAAIAADVGVAAGVVVGVGSKIGSSSLLNANAVIGANVEIGERCKIGCNVTIGNGVVIGDDVVIDNGAIIGAEGFGFAPEFDKLEGHVKWRHIHQLGSVVIGDRVYIGANTTIDRGALDDTVIENDVIIDNLVQIAHNCRIGSGTAIAGCAGLAGSSIVGKNCQIGGGVGLAGHLTLADGVQVLGMTLVNKSIDKAGVYASGTVAQPAEVWRKNAVRFSQLDKTIRRLSANKG